VTAKCLPSLREMTRLRHVQLPRHGSITRERIESFREALPFAAIDYWD
jgi:hypothetical protein